MGIAQEKPSFSEKLGFWFLNIYSILPKIKEKYKKRLTKAFAVVLQIYYNLGNGGKKLWRKKNCLNAL